MLEERRRDREKVIVWVFHRRGTTDFIALQTASSLKRASVSKGTPIIAYSNVGTYMLEMSETTSFHHIGPFILSDLLVNGSVDAFNIYLLLPPRDGVSTRGEMDRNRDMIARLRLRPARLPHYNYFYALCRYPMLWFSC